jgi:hypothetical protein
MKSVSRSSKAVLGGALSLSLVPVSAGAAEVYFNNFQGAVENEWSATTVASAPNPDYAGNRKFLGEFGAQTITLSLADLPAHTTATIEFSLFLIRSWDGEDTDSSFPDHDLGRDHWRFAVDGNSLFDETFSNGNPKGQSYTGPGTPEHCAEHTDPDGPAYAALSGAAECYSLGYSFNDIPNGTDEAMDSVYNFIFNVAHTGDSLELAFAASGLQSLADESWGLDDVRVSVTAVPVPAALPLLLGGLSVLGVVAGRRRRVA